MQKEQRTQGMLRHYGYARKGRNANNASFGENEPPRRFNYFSGQLSVLNNVRYLLPDPVVLLASLAMLISFRWLKILQAPESPDDTKIVPVPTWQKYLVLVLITVVGLAIPSLLNAAYLLLFGVAVLFLVFGRSLANLFESTWPFVLTFVVVHISSLYIYQLPYVYENTPSELALLLAFYRWSQFSDQEEWRELWPVLVSAVTSFLLFIMLCEVSMVNSLCRQKKRHSMSASQGALQTDQSDIFEWWSRGSPSTQEAFYTRSLHQSKLLLTKFLANHGWRVIIAGCLIVSILDLSLLSLPLLLVACLGVLISHHSAARTTLPILVYVMFLTAVRYFYNIPFGFITESKDTHASVLRNIGLVIYKPAFFYIGMQSMLCVLLALYFNFYRAYRIYQATMAMQQENEYNIFEKEEATSSKLKNAKEGSNEEPTTSTDAGDKSNEPTSARPLAHRASNLYNNMWKAIKAVVEVLWKILLRESYKLALAGLWVCSLTSINLLNAGYLLFFLVFILSHQIAMKAWSLLVIYTEGVIVTLYVWQLTWTEKYEGYTTKLIGLEHFDKAERGLFWHLIILLFSVVQYEVNQLSKHQRLLSKHIAEEPTLAEELEANLHPVLKQVLQLISDAYFHYGLAMTYLILLLVSLLTPTNVMNLVYLFFLFICFLIHLLFSHPTKHVRRLWSFQVSFAAVLLALRYAYQFDQLSELVEKLQPTYKEGVDVSLSDVGLQKFPVSRLFFDILPNAVVLVASVAQLRSFYGRQAAKKAAFEELKAAGRYVKNANEDSYEESGWLKQKWAALQHLIIRCLVLHSCHVACFVALFVGLSHICALNLVYLSVGLVFMYLGRYADWLAFPVMLFSQAFVMAQQIWYFETWGGLANDNAAWIGFDRSRNRSTVVLGPMFVMLAMLLQRYSYRWETLLRAADTRKGYLLFPTTPVAKPVSGIHLDDDDDNDEEEDVCSQEQRKLTWSALLNATKWHINNLVTLHGYYLFAVVLLFTAVIRVDCFSILLFLLLGACIAVNHAKLRKGLWLLVVLLTILLVAEYVCMLQLPPFLGISWPWHHLSVQEQRWLAFDRESSYLLALDYLLLFLSYRLTFITEPTTKPIPFPVTDYDFTEKPRRWHDQLKLLFFRYSMKAILVFVFVTGTAQEDLLSLGYMALSLYFLYRGDALLVNRNKSWRLLRGFNFIVILLKLIYIAPWIPDEDLPQSYQNILGLHKLVPSTVFNSQEGLIFDVIIFIMVSLQKLAFDRPEVSFVLQFIKRHEEFERIRANITEEVEEEENQKQLAKIQAEQAETKKRLEKLKRARLRGKPLTVLEEEKEESVSEDVQTDANMSWWHIQERERKIRMGEILPDEKLSNRRLLLQEEVDQEKEKKNLKVSFKKWLRTMKRQGRRWVLKAVDLFINLLHYITEEHLARAVEQKMHERGLYENSSDRQQFNQENATSYSDLNNEIEPNQTSHANAHSESIDLQLLNFDSAPSTPSSRRVGRTLDYSSDEQGAGSPEDGDEADEEDTDEDEDDEDEDEDDDEDYDGDEAEKVDRDFRRRWRVVRRGLWKSLFHNTHILCYLLMVINHTSNASAISVFFPISLFIYAALEYPRPVKYYWNVILIYVNCVLFVKFFFQISAFCICYTADGEHYDVHPHCADTHECGVPQQRDERLGTPHLLGLYKISHFFLLGVFWDLALLLAVLWHRYLLKMKGRWDLVPNKEKELEELTTSRVQWREWLKNVHSRSAQNRLSCYLQTTNLDSLSGKQELPLHLQHADEKDEDEIAIEKERDESDNQEDTTKKRKVEQGTFVQLARKKTQNMINQGKRIGRQVFIYFKYLFSMASASKDYYTQIFLLQLLSFFYLVVFQSDFTGIGSNDVIEIVSQNRVPRSYVILLICQFVLIVLERVIYLYQALPAKIALQYVLVFFFILPRYNDKPFKDSSTLIVFYLLQCIYFYVSSLQIRFGFPLFMTGRFLTNSQDPSALRRWIFMGYRAIPFVYELRTILDWSMHTTSLEFFEWLKLEDLYSQLFLVKCRIADRERSTRRFGQKQSRTIKIFLGIGLFLLLCAVIWFPLVLLASGNPGSSVNQVLEARISVGIRGWEDFFSSYQTQNISYASSSEFAQIRDMFGGNILPDERPLTQIIRMQNYSEEYWDISELSFANLKSTLMDPQASVNLQFQYSFTRPEPEDNPTIVGFITKQLTEPMKQVLFSMLDSNETGRTSLYIPSFFPPLYRVPLFKAITLPSSDRVDINLILERSLQENKVVEPNGTEVVVRTIDLMWYVEQIIDNDKLFQNHTGPELVTISVEAPKDAITRTITSSGIVGLYVGVVFAIGRFLRVYVTGLVQKIIYEDMPNVDALLRLCDDLFIARRYGNLVLEEELYRELIELYRSPQRLIEATRKKPKME